MMKEEFEKLAGYEVTQEDYNNIIEPMYMAVDVDKSEFVKMIDKKRFALKPLNKILKEARQLAEELKETCTHFTDYGKEKKLDELIAEYVARKYDGTASYMIDKTEKWTCYYPARVEIFGAKTYCTYEYIDLIRR